MNQIEVITSKIIDKKKLKPNLALWNFQEKKIVFTNGCFDILHRGHIEYLAAAANLGDILMIGLNSDNSVRKLKGESRPLQDEQSRAMLLGALRFVDVVVFFEEETPYELIKFVQPDILVKGKDYQPEEIAGYDIVMAKGGKVETIELTPGYSTTSILNKANYTHG